MYSYYEIMNSKYSFESFCLPMCGDGHQTTSSELLSGKRLHNYGPLQFLIGKSNINGHFQ